MVKCDFYLTHADKFWEWCKRKQLFSSIDISRYGLANYYLRANRTVREWSEPKDRTGIEPRLRRLDTREKIFRGLVKNGNQMISWYEVKNGQC